METNSTDQANFEKMAGEIASEIWNQLIEIPAFHSLKANDYVHVLDAVSHVLTHYQVRRID